MRDHLNNTQHGFRSGRYCLSALLGVVDDIMHMLSSDCTIDMIYLDFLKAFDKVDHDIILAPNDTAYTRFTVFGHAGHADSLDRSVLCQSVFIIIR